MCIKKLRNVLYYKWTSDARLMKRAASLRPMMILVGATYAGAFWFMLRCAMNEPDVSWTRKEHNFMSWTTIRPNYKYNFYDPWHDYDKAGSTAPPVYELRDEWIKKRHTGMEGE